MKTDAEPTDDEKKEKTFEYRSYGKGELAMLYLPDIQQQSAVDRFNKWIAAAPGLKERHIAEVGTDKAPFVIVFFNTHTIFHMVRFLLAQNSDSAIPLLLCRI